MYAMYLCMYVVCHMPCYQLLLSIPIVFFCFYKLISYLINVCVSFILSFIIWLERQVHNCSFVILVVMGCIRVV